MKKTPKSPEPIIRSHTVADRPIRPTCDLYNNSSETPLVPKSPSARRETNATPRNKSIGDMGHPFAVSFKQSLGSRAQWVVALRLHSTGRAPMKATKRRGAGAL